MPAERACHAADAVGRDAQTARPGSRSAPGRPGQAGLIGYDGIGRSAPAALAVELAGQGLQPSQGGPALGQIPGDGGQEVGHARPAGQREGGPDLAEGGLEQVRGPGAHLGHVQVEVGGGRRLQVEAPEQPRQRPGDGGRVAGGKRGARLLERQRQAGLDAGVKRDERRGLVAP